MSLNYKGQNLFIENISIKQFKPTHITLYGSDLTTKNSIKWYYYQNIINVKSKLT